MWTITWCCDGRSHVVCTTDGKTVMELYSIYKYNSFHVYINGMECDPEKGLTIKE
jgi:hypothetical protein